MAGDYKQTFTSTYGSESNADQNITKPSTDEIIQLKKLVASLTSKINELDLKREKEIRSRDAKLETMWNQQTRLEDENRELLGRHKNMSDSLFECRNNLTFTEERLTKLNRQSIENDEERDNLKRHVHTLTAQLKIIKESDGEVATLQEKLRQNDSFLESTKELLVKEKTDSEIKSQQITELKWERSQMTSQHEKACNKLECEIEGLKLKLSSEIQKRTDSSQKTGSVSSGSKIRQRRINNSNTSKNSKTTNSEHQRYQTNSTPNTRDQKTPTNIVRQPTLNQSDDFYGYNQAYNIMPTTQKITDYDSNVKNGEANRM